MKFLVLADRTTKTTDLYTSESVQARNTLVFTADENIIIFYAARSAATKHQTPYSIMYISLDWISDDVDLSGLDPKEIANRLENRKKRPCFPANFGVK